jgi:hypothetical protein
LKAGPFVLTGEVTEEYGAVTVTVKDMRLLKGKPSLPHASGEAPEAIRASDADFDWTRAA